MKKPVKPATLLEDVLANLIRVEETLLFDVLTEKQTRLCAEILVRLRGLVQDLSDDVAQEHRAA